MLKIPFFFFLSENHNFRNKKKIIISTVFGKFWPSKALLGTRTHEPLKIKYANKFPFIFIFLFEVT